MRKTKIFLIASALLIGLCGIVFVSISDKSLVLHPKGIIAHEEFKLIIINTLLMLAIIIPTFILLLVVAWKYRANHHKARYEPERKTGTFIEILIWIVPSIIVAIMAIITWKATHNLDPYKPLVSEIKPLKIQVVALDWKWLFIYPDQEIATLNFVQFPEKTPIHFELTADGSPMNSFWIPELSGQIYSMAGMVTSLHIMADNAATYSGKAAEINGEGYAKMTFVAHSSTDGDFTTWVSEVKKASLDLNSDTYKALLKPSINEPIQYYSHVEEGLFRKIVMKVHNHQTYTK